LNLCKKKKRKRERKPHSEKGESPHLFLARKGKRRGFLPLLSAGGGEPGGEEGDLTHLWGRRAGIFSSPLKTERRGGEGSFLRTRVHLLLSRKRSGKRGEGRKRSKRCFFCRWEERRKEIAVATYYPRGEA